MSTTYPAEVVEPKHVGESWVLVFGGVTRPGNRRARRVVVKALKKGFDVVWFDGFEERYEDTEVRVPLDETVFDASLAIVDYEETERKTFAGRLRSGDGLRSNTLTRTIWKVVLRRLGTILRPRAGWSAIRPGVESLAKGTAPQLIIYCDEYAITCAWYAGRLWRSVLISADFPQKTQ